MLTYNKHIGNKTVKGHSIKVLNADNGEILLEHVEDGEVVAVRSSTRYALDAHLCEIPDSSCPVVYSLYTLFGVSCDS